MKKYSSFHPLLGILGYRIVSLPATMLPSLLDLCRRLGASYGDINVTDSTAYLRLPFFGFSRLQRATEACGIELIEQSSHGIPPLLLRHRGRLGILCGLMCSILLILFSGQVIFDIRIDGEARLSEAEVKQALWDCGLKVGSLKKRLDIDVIENRVLIASDDISWISVNIIGNVAKVEIRELDFAPDVKEEELPPAANLVASENGTIVGLESIHGNLSVAIGDTVGKGQLLVGGIYGDELIGFGYTAARGRVLAEVKKDFSVTLPRKYPKKIYTGEEKCEKYLIFFEKEIKIFGNSRNLYPIYDKIDVVEYMSAPNGERLPVGIRTVRYIEYTYTEEERSDAQLTALAEYKMNAILSSYEGEILAKQTKPFTDDSGITLYCRARAIEDIAKTQKIDITQSQ